MKMKLTVTRAYSGDACSACGKPASTESAAICIVEDHGGGDRRYIVVHVSCLTKKIAKALLEK